MEQSIFLALMRLREKMGAEGPLPGGLTNGNGNDGGGGGGGGGKTTLVKDSRRSRGGNNIGDYTRTLWNSLGAGDNAAAAASAATDQHSGGGVGRGGTGHGGEARSSSGGGGEGRRYLVESANSNRTRLLAFAETLAAGESALSPGVFEVGGGQRAEVRQGGGVSRCVCRGVIASRSLCFLCRKTGLAYWNA